EVERSIDNESNEDIESSWEVLKEALTSTQKTYIGFADNIKTQEWMTDEILTLMN
ncbi:hypothetical protein HHI36_015634, partial [Cryptolaemus montrouzieri]